MFVCVFVEIIQSETVEWAIRGTAGDGLDSHYAKVQGWRLASELTRATGCHFTLSYEMVLVAPDWIWSRKDSVPRSAVMVYETASE
ncbi:hypothetical protein RRG08_041985 [Elysia crispata]|uniref:Uncharacterized protein n=1 Tax=Elysia crispata TaxID=231223 RepID=A0AAE0YZJ5_9GAST|nr:hypothetical protein RRG08_041985 [Elysia crispata]